MSTDTVVQARHCPPDNGRGGYGFDDVKWKMIAASQDRARSAGMIISAKNPHLSRPCRKNANTIAVSPVRTQAVSRIHDGISSCGAGGRVLGTGNCATVQAVSSQRKPMSISTRPRLPKRRFSLGIFQSFSSTTLLPHEASVEVVLALNADGGPAGDILAGHLEVSEDEPSCPYVNATPIGDHTWAMHVDVAVRGWQEGTWPVGRDVHIRREVAATVGRDRAPGLVDLDVDCDLITGQ